MKGKSGKQIGDVHVQRLEAYLTSVVRLPSRGGKINLSAVALACDFDRAVLYNNPVCRSMMEAAVASKDLEGIIPREAGERDEVKVRLERRIHELEQVNSALKAEIFELRQQLNRVPILEDHMVETGRRIKL